MSDYMMRFDRIGKPTESNFAGAAGGAIQDLFVAEVSLAQSRLNELLSQFSSTKLLGRTAGMNV
jgi:hypothetical protein